MSNLQVSQAEPEEKESTAQLEEDNLMDHVKTLQDTVHGLRSLLTETHWKYLEAKKVSEKILTFKQSLINNARTHDVHEFYHRLYAFQQNQNCIIRLRCKIL